MSDKKDKKDLDLEEILGNLGKKAGKFLNNIDKEMESVFSEVEKDLDDLEETVEKKVNEVKKELLETSRISDFKDTVILNDKKYRLVDKAIFDEKGNKSYLLEEISDED